MNERVTLPIGMLAEYLGGATTVVRCAPDREDEVRQIISDAAVPRPFYEVVPDEEMFEGAVTLTHPEPVGDWTP